MTHSYWLTEKELQVLAIVERDGDALLFDLEVQELASRGFIDDLAGTLVLTERGRRALQASDADSVFRQVVQYPCPTQREPGQHSV